MKTTHGRRLPLRAAAPLAALLLSPAAARAQSPGGFEVTAFGGALFGTRVQTLPTTETRIGNTGAWGLRAAWAFKPTLRVEASYSRGSADLMSRDPSASASYATVGTVDLDSWDADLLYDFGKGGTRGSMGLGFGAQTIAPTIATLSDSETRFTVNVTAGLRQWLGRHFALRLDGRWRWRDGKARIGQIVCDGECRPFTTNWYSSAELTAGVTYRF